MSTKVYNELALASMSRAEWDEFHRLRRLLSEEEFAALQRRILVQFHGQEFIIMSGMGPMLLRAMRQAVRH